MSNQEGAKEIANKSPGILQKKRMNTRQKVT